MYGPGISATRESVSLYMNPIPNEQVSICDQATKYSKYLVLISASCLAKFNKITLVLNMGDEQDGKFYNTQVVFDERGVLLAKYHKTNLVCCVQCDIYIIVLRAGQI